MEPETCRQSNFRRRGEAHMEIKWDENDAEALMESLLEAQDKLNHAIKLVTEPGESGDLGSDELRLAHIDLASIKALLTKAENVLRKRGDYT
jgi:hypothetical protein